MGWIKERIKSESRKHDRLGLEMWTRLAEAKIEKQIYENVEKWNKSEWYGNLNAQVSDEKLNELKCMITKSLNDAVAQLNDKEKEKQ